MRTSRRAFFWITILGVLTALVVFLQRRADDPAVTEAAGSTSQSIDATRTSQPVEPDGTSTALITSFTDEAQSQCARTISDAADFVTLGRNSASPVPAEESAGDRVTELAAAQRTLEASRDPEHFLAALLLDPAGRQSPNDAAAQTRLLDLGDRAVKSGSKVLAWHTLRACVVAKQFCPVAHLEQRLLEVDRQNADAWAMVATLRYERRDFAGAFTAMQGAARAPTSTWYWTETIALIERSLAAQSAMPYEERMGHAFGAGASTLPSQTNLHEMCKAESASSRAWAEACLAFGKLQAERNETDAARSIALSIRERALTALGDREGAAEVAAVLAHVRAQQYAMGREPAMSMDLLREAVMESDPSRLRAYFGAVQQFGEVAGTRMFLRQELPPLLERAGLLQREGVRECVAQYFVGTRQATADQRAQVADELHISTRSRSRGGQGITRIRPDGRITLPLIPGTRAADGVVMRTEREIEAAGKTTEQLQREIAAMLSEYHQSPEVLVTLLSPGSREELQREFDNARREAETRSNSR
jgi:hypothetical protein